MLRLALAAVAVLALASPARGEPPGAVEQEEDDEKPPTPESPARAPKRVPPSTVEKSTAPISTTPAEDKAAEAERAQAPYQGVAPGADHLPPRAPKLPLKKGPQRLTWSGFQLKDGVPTVFLEVTGAPDYRIVESGGALTVTLKNTVAPLRNNRRALKVEYFKTAVKEVDTAAKGHDLAITIHTDGHDKPTHKERVEPAAGGFQLLVIEIGK
jgi:hypothetical protein